MVKQFAYDYYTRVVTWLSKACTTLWLLHLVIGLRMSRQFFNHKGLAKLGNIVAKTLLRMQMFPRLAARETCVAETNFVARKQKMFLTRVKNIFASRTQILRPKHMFPSLATPGNITTNIVSATMFPSLARPLRSKAKTSRTFYARFLSLFEQVYG